MAVFFSGWDTSSSNNTETGTWRSYQWHWTGTFWLGQEVYDRITTGLNSAATAVKRLGDALRASPRPSPRPLAAGLSFLRPAESSCVQVLYHRSVGTRAGPAGWHRLGGRRPLRGLG